jgi:phosphoribosylanthranilate isomerase
MMNRRTRIKICGLTREADVDAAVAAGADAIGLVFYAKSSRHVTLQRATELAARLPPFVTPVGLFVNASVEEVEAAARAIPTLLLQFHGDETPQECMRHSRPFLRAARVDAGFDLVDFATRFAGAQAILLDAHVEGFGGGGKVFDWSLVRTAVPLPLVLSGGLHAGNVIHGIHTLRPWAVDVSSGVESTDSPKRGIKDADAIRRFCDAVREADARLFASCAASNA